MAGAATLLLAVGGAVLGLAGPASAHNYLIASTPAVDGTLTALPQSFEITTNDKLLDIGGAGSGFAFRVVGPDDRYYEDGCVAIDGPSMTTAAALGASGRYQVEWQIVSADGHTVSDEYAFTWKAPSGFSPATGAAKPPACATSGSASSDTTSSDTTTGTASGSSDSSASDALFIGAGGIVVVGAIVAVLLLVRRRPAPDPDDTDDLDD